MAVKRTAQLCNPTIQARNSIRKKIEALATEYNNYDAQVKSLEAGVRQITGFSVEQLVQRVVEPAVNEDGTPKLDKDGKPVKTTKYVPTSIVSYDKEHKQFVITTPDTAEPVEGDNAEAPATDMTGTEAA